MATSQNSIPATSRQIVIPEMIAESLLDSIIASLVLGEPDALERWLDEVPNLLAHAPDYDVVDNITAAIEGLREYEAMTAA